MAPLILLALSVVGAVLAFTGSLRGGGGHAEAVLLPWGLGGSYNDF